MGKSRGWVSIDRSLMDTIVWDFDAPFNDRDAYIDMIFRANFEDCEFKANRSRDVITVHAGELFTSIGNLAKRWRWSEGKVRRYLKMLEKCNFLKTKTYTCGTLITLAVINKTPNGQLTYGRANESANESTSGRGNSRTNERTNGRRYNNTTMDNNANNSNNTTRAPRQGIALGGIWGGEPE